MTRKTPRSAARKPYRVGRSRTGLGLFATAPIKRGAFIIAYRGRLLTHAQAAKLEARGNRYMYEINSRWTVDGSSRRNIARYANHSCRPNAESDVVKRNVILRAIKNIKPGDEITYDYGSEYFESFSSPSDANASSARRSGAGSGGSGGCAPSARPGSDRRLCIAPCADGARACILSRADAIPT